MKHKIALIISYLSVICTINAQITLDNTTYFKVQQGNKIGSIVLPLASTSGVSMGLISNTDYQIFAGKVSGLGTTNYLPKWTSGTGLSNSLLFDNGTNVGISTTNPTFKLDINGSFRVSEEATFSGYRTFFNNPSPQIRLGNQTSEGTWAFGVSGSAAKDFFIYNLNRNKTDFLIDNSTGETKVYGDAAIAGKACIGCVGVSSAFSLAVTGHYGIYVSGDPTGVGQLAQFGGRGDFNINSTTSVGGRFKVADNGNVGIGIHNGLEKLNVKGAVSVHTDTGVDGTFGDALIYGYSSDLVSGAARRHKISATLTGGSAANNIMKFSVWGGGSGTTPPTDALFLYGTGAAKISNTLDMSSTKILNVASGTSSTDAVNKAQLDTKLSTVAVSSDFSGDGSSGSPISLTSTISPGTYNQVTLDSKGRAISASNVTYAAKFRDSISAYQGFNGFRNALQSGIYSIYNVLFIGDSRVEQKKVSEPLRRQLIAQYGNAGIGFYVNWDYYPLGISNANNSLSNTFTQLDQTGDALYSFYGKAVSVNTTQAATGPVFFETTADSLGLVKSIDVYTLNKSGGGTIEVKVINKSNSAVLSTQSISTAAGATAPGKTTITLTTATNNIRIEYKATSGTATVLGFNLKSGNNGILFQSVGNGNSKIAEFETWNTNVGSYFANEIKPHLMITLMGVNDATNGTTTEQNPKNMRNSLLNVINTYRSATGANYFSAIVLGETGTRIADEYEDRINAAFYQLSQATATKSFITFINLKDVAPDWANMMAVPQFAWTTSDNVHWGTRGGLLASNYIYQKLTTTFDNQPTLFTRKYQRFGISATSYDIVNNSPSLGSTLYDTEIADYQTLNKLVVTVNGIERVYSSTATAFGWTYSSNTITAYDVNSSVETIRTISIEVLK